MFNSKLVYFQCSRCRTPYLKLTKQKQIMTTDQSNQAKTRFYKFLCHTNPVETLLLSCVAKYIEYV